VGWGPRFITAAQGFAAPDPGPGGIDALQRQELAAIHLEIGRRPTQLATELPALHHLATEAIRTLKQAGRLGQVAAGEGPADAAAAEALRPIPEHRHHRDGHTQPLADPHQVGGIAPAASTKAEVFANGHQPRLQLVSQHLLDEGLGAELGQGQAEGHQHQLPDGQGLQQGQLFGGQVEAQATVAIEHPRGDGARSSPPSAARGPHRARHPR
jgi:hypothetical protein